VPTTITTTTYAFVPCSTSVGNSGPSVIYSTYLTASYYPTTYVTTKVVYPTVAPPKPTVVTPHDYPEQCPGPVTVTVTVTAGEEPTYKPNPPAYTPIPEPSYSQGPAPSYSHGPAPSYSQGPAPSYSEGPAPSSSKTPDASSTGYIPYPTGDAPYPTTSPSTSSPIYTPGPKPTGDYYHTW
jgi:hypothetical protein